MKKLLKYIIPIMIVTLMEASPARDGLITFTQPDGTEFEGVLKGDSSFHWIESNSKIVMYNSEDKFYYNATLSANNKLEFTKEKPIQKQKTKSSQVAALTTLKREKLHAVDKSTKQLLNVLQREARKGHRPR